MFKYLCPTGDPTQYLNGMDYPEDPIIPEGFELIEGRPPDGAIPYIPLTLAKKLDQAFTAQPTIVKAEFYSVKAAIKLALEATPPDLDTARLILQNTGVPDELLEAKAALLALFN